MINSLNSYRSPRVLGYVAIGFIAGVAAMDLLSALIGFGQILNPELTFADETGEQFSIWFIGQGFALLFRFFFYVVAATFFLIWFNRANKNLTSFGTNHLQFTSGWAVGWWFIPFANLVKPFQVVREVWCGSDPTVSEQPAFLSAGFHSAPTYMGLWWAAYLVMNLIDNISSRVFDPDDLRTVALSGYFFVASGLMTAVAAGLAIYLVRDISSRQDARFSQNPDRTPTGFET